jgi:thiamine biosynthesis lipoprotein ApbE
MPSGVFETGDSPSAVAEALSTGFMIMSCDEIADCCLRHPGVEGRILISDPYDASVSPVLQRFAHDHQ